ncbi:autotransporter-associated beta strand repeat-containing protein, partial [Asaia spathodeae]
LQTSINHQINLVVSDGTLSFWDGGNTANHGASGTAGNNVVDGGDGTWTAVNGVGDNNWTNSAGSGNLPWSTGQFAVFEGQAGTVTVSNRDASGNPANVTFSGMQFANNDGGVYKVTGDDLYATTGTTTIRVGDGTSNGSAITANLDTVINDSNVSGGTSLIKSDAGTLIITKDQTYTGATTIDGGTLQLGNGGTSGRIASSSAIHNNGILAINHSDAMDIGQVIDGTGSLVQSGSGTTTLAGLNSYTGSTTISSGTLALNGGAIAASSGVHNNSIFDVSNATSPSIQALDGSGSTVLGNNTLVLTNANSSFGNIYAGVMSGAGGLTVNGGMQTLTGNNTYTGDTTVAANAGL